jgi:flagella synthesis protein FlgN
MNAYAVSQLDSELAELRKFVVLLSNEQQYLLDNDTDKLLILSETKTQTASQLMEIGNARRKALFTDKIDSMESWVSQKAPAQKALWTEIRKLAEQAQNLNTTNGELIQSRMRNNQQALGVLYNSSKNAAGLYGPDGQANINNAGRHLGSG